MNNEIDLKEFALSRQDVDLFMKTDFDLQRKVIDSAINKIAKFNEKTAEQALIIKLRNRIAYLEDEIDILRGKG